MKCIVTSYVLPDLDGTACAFAYAELLQKSGIDAIFALSGMPHQEAIFVLKKAKIDTITDAEQLIHQEDKIVLVDASDTRGISKKILPEQVIEIIDHRKIHEAHMFPNAKIQIEYVGSAATLIAEKFHTTNTDISKESALLLYSAIISNTINFKAAVTTERDKSMADRLLTHLELPNEYILEMFEDKSQFHKPLYDTIDDELATFTIADTEIGIGQLEFINVEKYVEEHEEEILSILASLKEQEHLDKIFLSCIDIIDGYNYFITNQEDTKDMISKTLQITFRGNIARREGIIMRKEIVPLLKELLTNEK